MNAAETLAIILLSALTESAGFYFLVLWRHQNKPAWLLLLAAVNFVIFVCLLLLHSSAPQQVSIACRGIYIMIAYLWLMRMNNVRLNVWHYLGIALCFAGMAVIIFAPR